MMTYLQSVSVNKLILVKNLADDVIVPIESAHFYFFPVGTTDFVVNYTETRLYNDDLIGLRELTQAGKVRLESIPGKHMDYKWYWLRDIMHKYFLD